MNIDLEATCKEVWWYNSRFCRRIIFPVRTGRNHDKRSHDSRCPNRNYSQAPLVTSLDLTCWLSTAPLKCVFFPQSAIRVQVIL